MKYFKYGLFISLMLIFIQSAWAEYVHYQKAEISVIIHGYSILDNSLNAPPMVYPKVKINNLVYGLRDQAIESISSGSGWVIKATVPANQEIHDIDIELYNAGFVDARIDIDNDADSKLDPVVNLRSGFGTVRTAQIEGDGFIGGIGNYARARVIYSVLINGAEAKDSDGDGLWDDWERNGVDLDANGIINENDVNLPAMGADPNHKDLFIEFDYVRDYPPTKEQILIIKDTLANAPLQLGKKHQIANGIIVKTTDNDYLYEPLPANPSGFPGINVWVDLGGLLDQNGRVLGEDFSGGNEIDPVAVQRIDDNYKKVKEANFTRKRLGLFRYALKVPRGYEGNPVNGQWSFSATSCSDGNDNDGDGLVDDNDPDCKGYEVKNFDSWVNNSCADGVDNNNDDDNDIDSDDKYCSAAVGWGGHDNILVLDDLPVIPIHEIGHTLGLKHGGVDSVNCKPNYLSIMNYLYNNLRYENGIPRYDFSPPRIVGENGRYALLPDLDEAQLVDDILLDANSYPAPVLKYSYTVTLSDGSVQFVNRNVNEPTDWNLSPDPVTTPLNIVSGAVICGNNSANDKFVNYNDFDHMIFSHWQHGSSAISQVNEELEPTREEIAELERIRSRSDIAIDAITKIYSGIAGTTVDYPIVVKNYGPNSTFDTTIRIPLITGVQISMPGYSCKFSSGKSSVLVCNIGPMKRNEVKNIQVRTKIDDHFLDNGNQFDLRMSIKFRGEDIKPDDNALVLTTNVSKAYQLRLNALKIDSADVFSSKQANSLDVVASLENRGPSRPALISYSSKISLPKGFTVDRSAQRSQYQLENKANYMHRYSVQCESDASGKLTIYTSIKTNEEVNSNSLSQSISKNVVCDFGSVRIITR